MSDAVPKQRVLLTDIHQRGNPTLAASRALLEKHGLVNFEIAKSSDEAEVVLYVENGYIGLTDLPRLLERVAASPAAKHFVFSESDWPFPVLPGAYPSLPKACAW